MLDKDDLEKYVGEGFSIREIAANLNVSFTGVRYWLKKLGLKTSFKKKTDTLNFNTCLQCGKNFNPSRNAYGSYCSLGCSGEHRTRDVISTWQAGKGRAWSGQARNLKPAIRRWLLKKSNFACSKCGWNKRHPVDGHPLVEINHIDGDAENCLENNLEVLCPNCHSETPNFRARNKTSKRNRK